MGRYELMFITKAGLNRDVLKGVVKSVAELIVERQGAIRKINTFGERVLPYRMSRHRNTITEGRYMLVDFILESKRLNEMDRYLLMEEQIIRHGIISVRDPYERLTEEELKKKFSPPDLTDWYRKKKVPKEEKK
eukprot:scpid105123/ scgid29149/ 28S ribosomal protein S6, mitochondrial